MAKKPPQIAVDRKEVTLEFEKKEPLHKELCGLALSILEKKLDESPIKIHSIPIRVKSLKSFFDKIDRYQIEKPFDEINDVVGLRIICLFLSDIVKIGAIIRNNFEVIREDNKIESSEFASFGYISVHFIVKLGENYSKTIHSEISEILFEIQVRTIAMDAWANISHYLDYKTDQDIPKDLKRDFYALNGMFYVADKHFQLFFEQREEKQEEISNVFEKGSVEDISSQPVNLDTLTAYLLKRFPDRIHGDSSDVSTLVQELTEAGYRTMENVNNLVEGGMDALLEYEGDETDTELMDIGAVRIIGKITDDNYLNISLKRSARDSPYINFNLHTNSFKKYKNLLKPAGIANNSD